MDTRYVNLTISLHEKAFFQYCYDEVLRREIFLAWTLHCTSEYAGIVKKGSACN